MIYVLLALAVVIIALQALLIVMLRRAGSHRGIQELLRRSQKEERRIRREQAERTNETIQLSMQLVTDSLSQNQAQLRGTTAAQLGQLETRIQGLEQANALALEQLRETVSAQMELLRAQNDARLKEMQATVGHTLQEQLETRLSESFQRVSESLERVSKGLGEMRNLAADVGGLKRVLSNVKLRGNLGEIQLGSILREILAPEQYEENAETVAGSGKRVEYAVKLPTEDGRTVYLPIDAKFPADCYAQLLDAQDSGDRSKTEAARAQLRQRLLGFAKDIREKYIREPETTAFGILFLPFEGLYAEAVQSGITEELQRRHGVTIAGPSTMAAMLNAIWMSLRTLAIQKQSDRVWEVLGGIRTEFAQFEDALNAAKRRIEAAEKELDQLVGVRTRAINRQLAELQGGEKR